MAYRICNRGLNNEYVSLTDFDLFRDGNPLTFYSIQERWSPVEERVNLKGGN